MKRILFLILICTFYFGLTGAQQIGVLDSLARTSVSKGDYPAAAQLYFQIFKMFPDSPSFEEERIIYAGKYTDCQLICGGYAQTEAFLKDSIDLQHPLLRLNLASALGYQEKYEEAKDILIPLASENVAPVSLRATALQNMGYLEMESGNFTVAEKYLKDAIELLSGEKRYITLSNLALVLGRNGKDKEALRSIDEALNGFKGLREAGERDYIRALRKKGEILLLCGRKGEAKKVFSKFFRMEKRWLLNQLPSLSLTTRLNLWNSEKFSLSKVFMLEDAGAEFLYDVALFRRLTSLLGNHDLRSVEALLSTDHSKIKKIIGKESASIEFVSYKALDGRDYYAAIIFTSDGKSSFVRLFDSGFIEVPNVVGKNSIMDAIRSNSPGKIKELYTESGLGEKVWAPILEKLPAGVRDIYFAPEGIFQILGVENLSFSGKEHLRLHRVSTTAISGNKNEIPADSMKMLLIGGLDYSSLPLAENFSKRDHRAAEELIRTAGSTDLFVDLPAAHKEVDSLKQLYSNADVRHEMEEGEMKRIFSQYKLVHIATHGYSLNLGVKKRPECMLDSVGYDPSLYRCALALTGANLLSEYDYDEDGLLSAREICDLDLSGVEFVVMSACQTAQGDVEDEGAAGLLRGLKNAGVNTVIATLWPIGDHSTMLFMKEFYTRWRGGDSKYEAFEGAREYVKKELKSPFYWAPYILIDGV